MVDTPHEPYVRFPKYLLDALLRSPMSGVQKDIAFAVVRRSIGHYNLSAAEIGLQLLVEMTGHHKTRLSKARQDLIREGVLVETRSSTCARAAVLAINRDPSKWGAYAVKRLSADCEQAADRGQQDADGESADCGEGISKTGTDLSADDGPLKTTEDISEELSEYRQPPGEQAAKGEGAKGRGSERHEAKTHKDTGRVNAATIMAECMAYAKAQELPVDDAYRGHLAREIQKALQAGHTAETIGRAARQLINNNRTPADLRWVAGDLARGGTDGGRSGKPGCSGRSIDGEF